MEGGGFRPDTAVIGERGCDEGPDQSAEHSNLPNLPSRPRIIWMQTAVPEVTDVTQTQCERAVVVVLVPVAVPPVTFGYSSLPGSRA